MRSLAAMVFCALTALAVLTGCAKDRRRGCEAAGNGTTDLSILTPTLAMNRSA